MHAVVNMSCQQPAMRINSQLYAVDAGSAKTSALCTDNLTAIYRHAKSYASRARLMHFRSTYAFPPGRINYLTHFLSAATNNFYARFLQEIHNKLRTANFHELFVMKIIKILATRSQILRLKCTKFDFGWGFTPDP